MVWLVLTIMNNQFYMDPRLFCSWLSREGYGRLDVYSGD